MESEQGNQIKSKNLHKPPLLLAFFRFIFRFIFRYVGCLFPRVVGRWSYRLWFQTHRSSVIPQREQNWLKAATRIEVVELAINEWGLETLPVMTYYWENEHGENAPLVMLLHGWTGRGSQLGGFAEPLLKQGFRVLAFDNHAHDNTPGKSTHLFIQSAVQCALAKKFGPIYAIITHSFGGMVTAYSFQRGLQTQKIVCVSSPSYFDFLLARFSSSLHLPQSIQNYMVSRFKKEYGDDMMERISSSNTAKKLGHIPALIIHDEEDQDVPISESELLHQAWPNSKFIRTQGLGHRRILYDADVIQSSVNFLKLDKS